MPIILEWRHRLLHLRASLERNFGQSRFHWILDLLSLPKYVIKKGRLHGHRYGQTPEKKEYHQAHNLKKEVHQEGLFRDPYSLLDRFRISCIPAWTWTRWRGLYRKGRSFGQEFLPLHDASRIFSIQTELVDLSHLVWKHRTIEKSFWLQRSVVHIKPSTPRIWRTTTQADALLEVPETTQITEFFLKFVGMEWFLVEFIIVQRKSINEDACKATW